MNRTIRLFADGRIVDSDGKAIGMTSTELDQFADAFEHQERLAAKKAIT